MRFRPSDGVFTDLNPISYLRPPNCIVKTGDADYRELIKLADLYQAGGINRHVLWEKTASNVIGSRYALEFVPYVHPVGAAAITLGTVAYAADGTATYTPTLEGRLLNESGVQVAANEEANDVAGLMLTDYFYHVVDGEELYEAHRALTINAGDFLWLVRRGRVELDATAAVNAGDMLMSSATVAGEVEPSTAINTGGTIAQYHASLIKHLTGSSTPNIASALAVAIGTIGGAGLVEAELLLPDRYVRTN